MFEQLLLEPATRSRLLWYMKGNMESCASLVLLGEKGIGKHEMATEIARRMLMLPPGMPLYYSPDFYELGAGRKNSLKEQVEDMMNFVSYSSVKAPRRVVLIDDANLINQNVLLKLLEDQAKNCVFLMVAHEDLLQTVYSRSVKLVVATPSEESLAGYLKAHSENMDPLLSAASGGRLGYYEIFRERKEYVSRLHRFMDTFNRMEQRREIMEVCGALKEKDPDYYYLLFDQDELLGFFQLLISIFRWNISQLEGIAQEPPFLLRKDMGALYPGKQSAEILTLLSKHKKMLKRKGRYSKNDFFDLLMKLVEAE